MLTEGKQRRKPSAKELANLRPWKPGQSGNPSGRPRKRLLDWALEEQLEALDSAQAAVIAAKLLKKAANGDVRAAQLIAERTEGKPKQKVEVTGAEGSPVSLTVEFVTPDK